MKRFEFVDHTADVIVRAYGASLAEAFEAAADAMFALITGDAPVAGNQPIEVEVKTIDREGLLVGFLSDLIALSESQQLVLCDMVVTFHGDRRLTATGLGECFDRAKHGEGIQVKGVSYHMLEINEGVAGELSSVQVLLDI